MVSFSRADAAAVGAPFSSSLSSLTFVVTCDAGVDAGAAGVVGPSVVFGRFTTWTLSRRNSTVDLWSGKHDSLDRVPRSVLHLHGSRIPIYSYMSLNDL